MGGEELKWPQLAHHQLTSQQGPHFSPHREAKANDKSPISVKLVSSGISHVAFASVLLGENPSEEVDYDGERAKRSRHSQVCTIEIRG